jgi:periplasmic protein CpxP/Spy
MIRHGSPDRGPAPEPPLSIFRSLTLAIADPRLADLQFVVSKRRYRHSSLPKSRKGTTMSSFNHPIAIFTPFARSVAITALIGAAIFASPLTTARAVGATNTAIQLAQAATPQNHAAAGATKTKGETVEQRITSLHKALKITADEESNWNNVAQAMRENAATMDKLVAETRTTPPQNMTAEDDLATYEKFAQAHVDGLENLISSFNNLYDSMPDAQKKNADKVFMNFGHTRAPSHS